MPANGQLFLQAQSWRRIGEGTNDICASNRSWHLEAAGSAVSTCYLDTAVAFIHTNPARRVVAQVGHSRCGFRNVERASWQAQQRPYHLWLNIWHDTCGCRRVVCKRAGWSRRNRQAKLVCGGNPSLWQVFLQLDGIGALTTSHITAIAVGKVFQGDLSTSRRVIDGVGRICWRWRPSIPKLCNQTTVDKSDAGKVSGNTWHHHSCCYSRAGHK